MRIVGLITEYNPFHNGHLHHLRESLRVSGAEASVAVMSGHFLQRGEPALVDKWVRTEMALRAGVDLVLELPFPFACNSAPHFASGAVRTLGALGGVTDLCFGSESGDLGALQRTADLLRLQGKDVERGTAVLLRQGRSYPEARERVVAERAGPAAAEVLGAPNNILGVEYLKALGETGSVLRPHTVRRVGAGYHEIEAAGEIASATGIRRRLAAGEEAAPYLPAAVRPILEAALGGGGRLEPDRLHHLLLGRILSRPDSVNELYLVEHGLGERLRAAALESAGWEPLVERVKGRQLTRTRIQRLLLHILNESRTGEMEEFLASGPLYLRALGHTEKGREVLAAGRKDRTLPLLTNLSRAWPTLKKFYGRDTERFRLAESMLNADLRATRLYTLLMTTWDGGNRNRDFFEEVRTLWSSQPPAPSP